MDWLTRNLKLLIALLFIMFGVVAFFMKMASMEQVLALYGGLSLVMQVVEKYIEPKKEAKILEEVAASLNDKNEAQKLIAKAEFKKSSV